MESMRGFGLCSRGGGANKLHSLSDPDMNAHHVNRMQQPLCPLPQQVKCGHSCHTHPNQHVLPICGACFTRTHYAAYRNRVCVYWTELAQDRIQKVCSRQLYRIILKWVMSMWAGWEPMPRSCDYRNEPLDSTKGREFPD
jgi:hypothetical protein